MSSSGKTLAEICTETAWRLPPIPVLRDAITLAEDVLALVPDPMMYAGDADADASTKRRKLHRSLQRDALQSHNEIPLLFALVLQGRIEVVKMCLEKAFELSPKAFWKRLFGEPKSEKEGNSSAAASPPHLVLSGPWRRCFLHYICDYELSEADTLQLLQIVLDVTQQQQDEGMMDWDLNWGHRDAWGLDFLATVAYRNKLAAVWPLLRRQPYYRQQLEKRKSFVAQQSGAAAIGDLPPPALRTRNPNAAVNGRTAANEIATCEGDAGPQPVLRHGAIYPPDWERLTAPEREDFK